MICTHDTCSAPPLYVARLKIRGRTGPGAFELVPNIAACDEHKGEIGAKLPADACVQVIPIPAAARDLEPDTVAACIRDKREDNERTPAGIAVSRRVTRHAAIAALRMAGL